MSNILEGLKLYILIETDLPQNAVLLLSTVSHKYYDTLSQRIAQAGRPDILLVDYYTRNGGKTAAEDTVNIWVSGTNEALTASKSLLHDLSNRLHVIPGGIGSASKVALVSQLLIGIHAVTAAEATGLAEKAGLFSEAYEIVRNAAGGSTVYESLVPLMLRKQWESESPFSALLKNLVSYSTYCRTKDVTNSLSRAPPLWPQESFIFRYLWDQRLNKSASREPHNRMAIKTPLV